MIKLTIDGREVEVEEGQTILEVAQSIGIQIPTLCYHKVLSPYGACRLCTVEIVDDGRPRLTSSCTYPVEEGLEVKTDSELVRKTRQIILELLLARSPNSDEIKKLADQMGVKKCRFKINEDLENKCILCGLCVRICREVMGVGAIGFANRGAKREVMPPFDEHSEVCRTCGACALVCPTGAIKLDKISKNKPIPIPSEFDVGLASRPAIYIQYPQAVPNTPVIDKKNCIYYLTSYCKVCENFCEAKAIKYDQEDEHVKLDVGSIILSPGFEKFDPRLKKEYGYGLYPNVITSVEFERMLSASGPFQGQIKRLSDARTPTSIAFIQCVGSRDVNTNAYCSAVCCMYAIKQALMAREHLHNNVNTHIFFMDIRAFGKEFDEYYMRALENGVKFSQARIGKLYETSENNLLIRYVEDGDIKTAEFELVVLGVGLEASKFARQIAQKTGIELNQYGFCKTSLFKPLDTTIPGIYVAGAFSQPKDIPDSVAQGSAAAARASSIISSERNKLIAVKHYPPEIDVEGLEPRIGVFVCNCGLNIGGVVNVPEVTEYAAELPKVVYAEHNMFTCAQDTQRRIIDMIKEHRLNRIVVASCTPRTHESLFQRTLREAGLNPYLFEMANIRDQCSWVHADRINATEKAKDLIRMAVARASLLEPLYKTEVEVLPAALVIGGGLAGLIAALEIAQQGFEVHIVERTHTLGGNIQKLRYLLETSEKPQHILKQLIDDVKKNEKIKFYTNAELKKVEGYAGNFTSTIMMNDGELKIKHGVVIVATGGTEYKPSEYLYGSHRNVVTQLELEQMLANGRMNANTVVMIQCVGSRNDARKYCSRICCTHAIKNALKIKELVSSATIYILYKDIRTYGFREDYYRVASEKGVVFIRYTDGCKPDVNITDDNKLQVSVTDHVLDRKLIIQPDLLVLSPAILPSHTAEHIAKILKVPLTKDNFFLEAHMKLRPVDFAANGIFVCGLAHSPKFIDETITQACAAAARASTILSKKKLETGGVVAAVDDTKCSTCLTCVRICPYEVPAIVEGTAYIEDAKCHGCGACAANCPAGAIQLLHYKDTQLIAKCNALLSTSQK